MKQLLSEFFDIVEKQANDTDRANLILNESKNDNFLKWMLRLNYDRVNIKMLLPEGTPPFKKIEDKPMGYEEATLYKAQKKFYIWLDPRQNLKQMKRESLFIELLESLHYTEAELICLIKDGKLTEKYPSITEKLVRKIFPQLLPPTTEPEPPVKRGRGRPRKEK